MESVLAPVEATTPAGFLLVLALAVPYAGALMSLALGGRQAERIVLVVLPACLAVSIAVAAGVLHGGRALVYVVGGWAPPLGVVLRADGLSAAMMLTAAVVMAATGLFARRSFRQQPGQPEARAPLMFWTLFQSVWGALNAVFIGNDLFNLYVALELLTFSAIPMVCLDGRAESFAAALRYLLFALMGSLFYLLGTALVYGTYGTLDILQLSRLVSPAPAMLVAAALMTTGLLAKTALFPLHFWLPPAHAGAPSAASAVLSSLVIKASFFILLRLWFDVMPGLMNLAASELLALLGSAAIFFGSVVALRQMRLKLLIAYSTVAQIGYLFLMFPLAAGVEWAQSEASRAFTGGMLQAISHALAKAAMFMAAGLMAEALGHDRISGLGGTGRMLPVTTGAFALAGLSLMGLPPSGGFTAKWLLLMAAVERGQWWWALVTVTGGLLTGAYVARVLTAALSAAEGPLMPRIAISRGREVIVLALALGSVLLGLLPLSTFGILHIGRLDHLSAGLP
jgi:multicomponent Na+:H+ antiporter subunit D